MKKKKRNILLAVFSTIMAVSVSVPACMAIAVSAEEGQTAESTEEKTITVNIFNGDTSAVTLDKATAAKDGDTDVISVSNAWSGAILLAEPIDLSKAKNGQLCFEYKTTGASSWGKVNAVTFANGWNEPITLNGNGDSVGVSETYVTKKYDLSSLTEAQLAKFKGMSIGTSASFLIKRVWVEYPNSDYTETIMGYDIFTGVTAVEEPAQNAAKTAWTAAYTAPVSGKAVSDGTALAFGTLDDGGYYVSGTNAGTATRVTIGVTDITPALLFGGTLQFRAKFDFAGTEGTWANLRLYYECGQWGEAAYVELPLSGYTAGEWKDYSVAIADTNVKTAEKTSFGNTAPAAWFDYSKFVGIGMNVGSAGEGDNTASFANVKITGVSVKKVTGIEASGAKTDYQAGESFDASGMTVKAVLEDGSKVEVKNYTFSSDALVPGTDKVTISWAYNGQTYTADVNVNVVSQYTALKVTAQPKKTAYKAGEKFEKDGMVVKAVLQDNSEEEITDYTVYTGMLTGGTTSLEITYNGLKTSVAITVAEFENTLSLTNKVFASDGAPNYGWTAQVASSSLTSQAKYDAATEEEQKKLIVTQKDETHGYYITATFNSNNYATRIFEYGVADYSLGTVYDEVDYNGMVSVTYRTSSALNKAVNFGLANFKDWNLGYHCVDISSLIVADGEWHTLYFDIGLINGEVDGMLWGGFTGDVNLNTIVGFAIQSQADGTLDIADVSVNWNGPQNAAKAVDTTAPEFTYSGEMAIIAKAGDVAPAFGNEKAIDKNDGEVSIIAEWSEGAVTNGKLNEGKHTVRLYAKDAAGNISEVYTVTVTVEKNEAPDPVNPVDPVDPEPSEPDEPSDDNGKKKGCSGAVGVSSAACAILALTGVGVVIGKKKKED